MTTSVFDRSAGQWDNNPLHHERSLAVANAIVRIVPLNRQMRVLEYGAGTGLLSFILRNQTGEIVMMDKSAEMVKVMQEKVEKEKLAGMYPLLYDLEKNDYEGNLFDLIMNQMVMHHIKDIPQMLKRFFQMLTPGGYLAMADLYSEDGSFHQDASAAGVHHFGFDPARLAREMQDVGFIHVVYEPCFVIKRPGQENKIKEFPLFILTGRKGI